MDMNGWFQDLVFVVYYHLPQSTDSLSSIYIHCIPSEKDKKMNNDVKFVVSVWHAHAQEYNLFKVFDDIYVWSDGGPNHFKLTNNLGLMCKLKWE